jgi:ribose/xylose/arabinose/galactoside ABC-type transport system permease subunit
MSPRTLFLGRLIGLYCILISLTMLAHKQATVEVVSALVHNPPVLFVAGVIAVAVGLALILGHNVWSGGAPPVIVTLVGWLALIKGLLILLLSPEAAAEFFLGRLHYEEFYYWYAGASLFLGIYLIYRLSRASTH